MTEFNPYRYFLDYLIKSKLGAKRPFLAGYKITTKCNLNCGGCVNYLKEEKDLRFNQIQELFKKLKERGNIMLMLEGGEPFLWKDGDYNLEDVVKEARNYFHFVGITTNGTQKVETSADTVWVSIGGLEETHNGLRNGRVFEHAVENIKGSTHPRIYSHTTINSVNQGEIGELVRYVSEIDNIRGMSFQFYYPYENDGLFIEDRKVVLDRLIALKQDGYKIMNSFSTLRSLYENEWTRLCSEYNWMVDNVRTNGKVINGCYVESEGYEKDCTRCGFTVYTELINAFRLKFDAIKTGLELYVFH
jgi:MoaA/NifB/PqqE/SkfB family radical SAM enzyme